MRRINNALLRADQIDFAENGRRTREWLAPIVADAEAGFGGPLNAYELMHQMISAGAAGVHCGDQLRGRKKCGHLGGKVLVPDVAARAHALGGSARGGRRSVPTIIVARTDALGADLLTSDIDSRDEPFLTGERTVEGTTGSGPARPGGRPRRGVRRRTPT